QLVVMAACAGNGGRQETFAQGVDDIGHRLLSDALRESVVSMPPLAEPQSHRSMQRFVQSSVWIDARLDEVASDVLHHKLSKRHRRIPRSDQLISIHPSVFRRYIPFVAVCICVVDDIHPMSCPMFAKVR